MVAEAALWLFSGIGVGTCLHIIYQLSQFIYPFIRSSSITRYKHGIEPWALITGASDGIGFGFVEELCSHGFNVILHGRNEHKLSICQAKLETEFPDRKFRTFIFDVTQDSSKAIETFAESVKDLCLTVLVNNVGGTKGFLSVDFKPFSEHTSKEVTDLIHANLHFSTQLTRALLPNLTTHQPSLIISTDSASDTGMPYLSVYTGTKAFISAWSNGLGMEFEAEGVQIEVLACLSGTTQSNQNRTKESVTNPSARTFARASLRMVGGSRTVGTAWWMHAVLRGSMALFPASISKWAIIGFMRPMRGKMLSDTG